MTREEASTIIGLLEQIEDKRLAYDEMWDEDEGCACAQGAICSRPLWDGRNTLTITSWQFVNDGVAAWAKEHKLSAGALVELEGINDGVEAFSPEERYAKVMAQLRRMLG